METGGGVQRRALSFSPARPVCPQDGFLAKADLQ